MERGFAVDSTKSCLMVGNDVTEDMVAEKAGMQVFLLTDCLINKERKDIFVYPRGSFLQLLDHIETHQCHSKSEEIQG